MSQITFAIPYAASLEVFLRVRALNAGFYEVPFYTTQSTTYDRDSLFFKTTNGK